MVSSGTGYMGSTNKAITALKATFQTPLYPLLDQVRSALGAKFDLELAHLKVNCCLLPSVGHLVWFDAKRKCSIGPKEMWACLRQRV